MRMCGQTVFDILSSEKDKDKHQGVSLGRMIALVLAAVRLLVELRKL